MKPSSAFGGFTLVELLIVIGLIGLLLQLAIPAVRSSRESARRIQCGNHMRQIGLSVQAYESAHQHLPTGGWGWAWIGDPNRGTGKKQPGGWAYQLLPYLEQQNVHDIGLGAEPTERPVLIAKIAATPVSTFYCPTRRAPLPTPTEDPQVPTNSPDTGDLFWYNSAKPKVCARLDYAANNGDEFKDWKAGPSPSQVEELGDDAFQWLESPTIEQLEAGGHSDLETFNGLVIQRHPVRLVQITDGLSNTYFAAEKRLRAWRYKSGNAGNDDQSAWSGSAWDHVVSTYWPPAPDPSDRDEPRTQRDPRGGVKEVNDEKDAVGSAHATGFNVVFCDGSVHYQSYDIDPLVHRSHGNRSETRD